MNKRLYRVRVEFEFYALAESEDGARTYCRDAFDDWDDDEALIYIADALKLSSDWADEEPYGSDGRSCAEILGCDAASLAEHVAAEAARAAWEAHPKLPLEVAA